MKISVRCSLLNTKMSEPNKPNNLKTALIFAGVALFFFVAVFVKRIWLS